MGYELEVFGVLSLGGVTGRTQELSDESITSARHVPRLADNTHRPSDVTNDVGVKMAAGWLESLVELSTLLSRFITLEYFSDGAALTKALAIW